MGTKEEQLIYTRLAMVMKDVQPVAKTDRNRQQGFSFRGIDAVLNAVAPVLRQYEVIVVPEVTGHTYQEVEIGKNRTKMAHVVVEVDYHFCTVDGSEVIASVIGEAMDSGDKVYSKAMSVAFRTALIQTLALPTGEPDPDSQTYERSEPEPSAEVVDEQAELREAILDWTKQNERNIREVAAQFAQDFGHPITEATTSELKEFYAKLQLTENPVGKVPPEQGELGGNSA